MTWKLQTSDTQQQTLYIVRCSLDTEQPLSYIHRSAVLSKNAERVSIVAIYYTPNGKKNTSEQTLSDCSRRISVLSVGDNMLHLGRAVAPAYSVASYPGLLTPTFVACRVSTASEKRWGEKAWVRGYLFYTANSCVVTVLVQAFTLWYYLRWPLKIMWK